MKRLALPLLAALLLATVSPAADKPKAKDAKAIHFPSGEKRGCTSYPAPLVIRVAVPPPMGSVYRSPTSEKTILPPSGDTSSGIHVALSVVKAIVCDGP